MCKEGESLSPTTHIIAQTQAHLQVNIHQCATIKSNKAAKQTVFGYRFWLPFLVTVFGVFGYRFWSPFLVTVFAYRFCLPFLVTVFAYRFCLPFLVTVFA